MTTIKNREITAIQRETGSMMKTATALKVVDEGSAQGASEMLVFVIEAKKKLEAQRVFLVKPLNDHVKDINAAFKDWVKPLEEVDVLVRSKLLTFQREQEAIRIEAQRLEQERIEREAAEGLLDDLPEDLPVPAPRIVRGQQGSASVRKTWTFEVGDEALVPREYLTVDEGVIALAVRQGIRDIPGIRIFQQDSIAVRSKA